MTVQLALRGTSAWNVLTDQDDYHTLAPSVCTIRKTTQEQGDMVLLGGVIYSEDNLQ